MVRTADGGGGRRHHGLGDRHHSLPRGVSGTDDAGDAKARLYSGDEVTHSPEREGSGSRTTSSATPSPTNPLPSPVRLSDSCRGRSRTSPVPPALHVQSRGRHSRHLHNGKATVRAT